VFRLPFYSSLVAIAVISLLIEGVRAQTPPTAPTLPQPDFQRPAPAPTEVPPLLPSPQDLIPKPDGTAPAQPQQPSGDAPQQVRVKKFEPVGSTVFSAAELQAITAPYLDRDLDFSQLLQVATEITQAYVKKGYINSGAFIPGNQSFDPNGGTVRIEIIEGSLSDIVVKGTERLDPNYIKSRVALGASKPFKIDRAIESLQLLQLDPLIKSISTELTAGTTPGTSILEVKVVENPTWKLGFNTNNNRPPSIGELQGQINLNQTNLFGLGDGVNVSFGATEASSAIDFGYTLPLNPQNGTLRLQYSNANSRVIEAPFRVLDISGNSQDLALSYRQPLYQTPAQEFALGLTLGRRESNTGYLASVVGSRVGYPTPGADANGTTRVTAARFFQDYTSRDSEQVIAFRSQVNLGFGALDATINAAPPDGRFVSWRGQAQYVRALAADSIFLARLETQIADRPLPPLEQIGFGGQDTVRGYRQDALLADSGVQASAEARFPIFRNIEGRQVLQIVPFADAGFVWNQPIPNATPTNSPNAIVGIGAGLRYQAGDNFSARLDYGIPLTAIDSLRRTGQERGFYFTVNYNYAF
jgi:hemolysin activation/secretion protein